MVEVDSMSAMIEPIAEDSLEAFAKISDAARKELGQSSRSEDTMALAQVNTFTDAGAIRNRQEISDTANEARSKLVVEPAIARVLVMSESGEKRIYYICRTSPVPMKQSGIQLASARAPVGRFASLQAGDALTIGGEEFFLVESAKLRPKQHNSQWDSENSVFEGEDFGPITIVSLRQLLEKSGGSQNLDALERLLAEDTEDTLVIEGIRKTLIEGMSLRDQPILDRFQDEVFRLPIDSQLLLLGPPGTGKTTTLIRRLGQKLDVQYLQENERVALEKFSVRGGDHRSSWIMFTPTELLKLYVKEAFNREGIAAPDQRIMTWEAYRSELARNTFSILRSSSRNSGFVQRSQTNHLKPETLAQQIQWYEHFLQWHRDKFWGTLKEAAEHLAAEPAQDIVRLGNAMSQLIDTASASHSISKLQDVYARGDAIRTRSQELKTETDKSLRSFLNLRLNQNRSFIDELSDFIETLSDSDEGDDLEYLEEEAVSATSKRAETANAYTRAIRTYARNKAKKRSLSAKSRSSQIVKWLGDRMPREEELLSLGKSLELRGALSTFSNPAQLYVSGMPRSYRAYRREAQTLGQWYNPDLKFENTIDPLETDIVLLAILRASSEIAKLPSVSRDEAFPAKGIVDRLISIQVNQVLVDEATDFSPIQLAAMSALSPEGLNSFFACGDFNQRVTLWGSRTEDDIEWVAPKIHSRVVTIAYRQSGKLNAFASGLVRVAGGSPEKVVLPKYTDNEGVNPVLITDLRQPDKLADWLASRIVEVEALAETLPSIAVLVPEEADVGPIADALQAALEPQNINVLACRDGQVKGSEAAVRVFNVEHIKGLEFEAVFFVGLDRLAKLKPDLFDKYLYVGATRAASFLGVACDKSLPIVLEPLRDQFGTHWVLSV